jgi:hypothetical protein
MLEELWSENFFGDHVIKSQVLITCGQEKLCSWELHIFHSGAGSSYEGKSKIIRTFVFPIYLHKSRG